MLEMSEKVWIGAIYLKDEGGYEIILKSLNHYKNRLRTLGKSPELKESAAMFAPVLSQQAMKIIPVIDQTIQKIHDSIQDIQKVNLLKEDIPFFEKALSCYESDIHKAWDTGHEYFVTLVGNMEKSKIDLELIKTALNKIKEYSQ
jgi:hypothetical protein